MTLTNATSLNDQVDFLSTNGPGYASKNSNSIFNTSPRNAVIEEDDDDDIDETIPDPDEDELFDDDDDTFPDEPDAADDFDDADIIDDDDLDDDDDKGSTTSGMNTPHSFADRPQGRTTGRMTDHEPGSGTANNL